MQDFPLTGRLPTRLLIPDDAANGKDSQNTLHHWKFDRLGGDQALQLSFS
jgi:hypothetical protein